MKTIKGVVKWAWQKLTDISVSLTLLLTIKWDEFRETFEEKVNDKILNF